MTSAPRASRRSEPGSHSGEPGRDGVTGLLAGDRALRAREVSRPRPEDHRIAEEMVDDLLARLDGRRRRAQP